MINLWSRIKHFFLTFGSKKVPAIENSGESTTPPVADSPVQKTPNIYPQIVLGKISCEYDSQNQIIKNGFDCLNKIISSDLYNQVFLKFPFEQTNGMTNQEIYDYFCKSSPVVMNVDLRDMGWKYNHIYRTVGLDNADDPDTIYMNSYFVTDSLMVLSNAIHETMHKLGFSHNKPTDYKSVPYGQNTIVEKLYPLLCK